MTEDKENKIAENTPANNVASTTPSTWTIVKIVLISSIGVTLIALLVLGLYRTRFVLFLILLSIYLAYLLDPLVNLIRKLFQPNSERNYMPRTPAILIAYLIVFAALWLSVMSLAPSIARQARRFANEVPRYTQTIQDSSQRWVERYQRLSLSEDFENWIAQRVSNVAEGATQSAADIAFYLTFLPWLFVVPVFAFYFLKDAGKFRQTLLNNVPRKDWRGKLDRYLLEVNTTIAAYTRAQLTSVIIIGIVCILGFSAIGLEFSVLLGFAAGILEFIPLLGPLTIGVVATTVGVISDNPWQGLWTAIFLIVLRIIYDYFLYPRIVQDGIHLHPLAIIVSVIVGEQLGGIPGVFLSIPVVAILTVTYRHLLKSEAVAEQSSDDDSAKDAA